MTHTIIDAQAELTKKGAPATQLFITKEYWSPIKKLLEKNDPSLNSDPPTFLGLALTIFEDDELAAPYWQLI